jgi:type II secretory pathway pseudopilin PulG
MHRRGVALIAVLVVAAVMTVVGSLLFLGTLGDLRQTRSTLQAAQARAAAEAGLTYARYAMEVARGDIKAILVPKMNLTANPSTEWVLPESQWPGIASAIQSLLNTGYGSLPPGAVDQGQASLQFTVTRFRGNTKGATAQTYRADYVVVSTGQVGPARRRTEEKGYFEVQLGRPALSQWLFLVDDAGGQTGFFPTGTVFNGPVHANRNWGFWGRPVFRDVVSTSDDGAWYWSLGRDGCTGGGRVWVRGDSRPPLHSTRLSEGLSA